MNPAEKLSILAMSAKYDVSCSSSGSSRKNTPGGIGNAERAGICHSWSDDGRCISLLKILVTNNCVYDCAYCINRSSNDVPRAVFTPEEIADITINFYRRNYIEGLFLSSAVFRNPDYTMELIIRSIELIRIKYKFNGYIHIKAMPGADPALIRKAGLLADRMSVNIELPSRNSLEYLAPQKTKRNILTSMNHISENIEGFRIESKNVKHRQKFVPAGQSTQLIVGATPEKDSKIIKLSEVLYNKFSLKRVYYSAFMPVSSDSRLPMVQAPLKREHRLYQADWLLRFYGFSADELFNGEEQNLEMDIDPKFAWAVRNLDKFPVEINKADYEMILRVPGIGVRSAKKIVTARRVKTLRFDDLKKIGVVLKRAKYFLTCSGSTYDRSTYNEVTIKKSLVMEDTDKFENSGQLFLFRDKPALPGPETFISAVTGEL